MVYLINILHMKRRILTPQENAKNMPYPSDECGLHHTILRQPSIIDEFYFEKCNPSDCSKPSVSVVDPIIMLFNQERLTNMGASAAKQFLDSLQPRSNALAELRQQCSDEDLMKMVKSRHLQSPAEILMWCQYIEQNIDEFNSEVARLQAEEIEKQTVDSPQPDESVETKS